MIADDFYDAYISTNDSVQGTLFGQQTGTWQSGAITSTVALTPGMTNYLHIRARDVFGAPSMILGQASLSDANAWFSNNTQGLLTNTSDWSLSLGGFGSGYFTPTDIGANGTGPWGNNAGISLSARRLWSQQTGGEHYFSVPIFTAVPEPSSVLALASAGLLLALRKRNKR